MTVRREYQIIEQSVINTENMIMKYTIQPSDFSLAKISGLDNANNIPNGGIQVNFMLVKNDENIGTIGFTNKWNLITQTIEYNGNIYKIVQQVNKHKHYRESISWRIKQTIYVFGKREVNIQRKATDFWLFFFFRNKITVI